MANAHLAKPEKDAGEGEEEMSEKCGFQYPENCEGCEVNCILPEALAHLKALILAQAFRSEVSDAAEAFVKAHS
jgi:hypothetical protein